MAKDKIILKANEVEPFTVCADLANVKIMSTTPMGDETIAVVRFRQPASLFNLGRYLEKGLLNKISKPKIKTNEKRNNQKTA